MQLYHHLVILSAAAIMASCSQHELPELAPSHDDAVAEVPITFHINIDDGLAALGSRSDVNNYTLNVSPRTMTTWQGQQSVNDVRIYVFSSPTPDGDFTYYSLNGVPAEYRVPDFCNTTPWTGPEFEFHSYTISPKLEKGRYYKFLVVGRDDRDGGMIPDDNGYVPWGIKTLSEVRLVPGVTKIEEASISNLLHPNYFPYITTELFTAADTTPLYVENDNYGALQRTLTMTRAVAALWLYVTDIPTRAIDNVDFAGEEFKPDELTLHLTVGSESMLLASQSDKENSRRHANLQAGYMDFRNLYFNPLLDKKWHRGEDGFWHRDAIDNYYGMRIAENCGIMTNFIFPIDEVKFLKEGECTLTLLLRQHIGDETKQRVVKCRILGLNGNNGELDVDPLRFPIKPNCIYALGSEGTPLSLASLSAYASRSTDAPEAPVSELPNTISLTIQE